MRRLPNGQKCTMSDVYKPAGEARLQLGGESGPASQQVTNTMNVNSSGVGSRTQGPDPPSTLPGASESVDGVDVVSKEWLALHGPTAIGPNIEWM